MWTRTTCLIDDGFVILFLTFFSHIMVSNYIFSK
jgi:hypothetical protein